MTNKFRLKPSFITLCVTALLLSVQFTARASTIRYLDIDQMLAMSELVFEGRVVSKESRWNDSNTFIHTYITFVVDDVVVGDYQQSTLELRFDGGTVDDEAMLAEGSVFPEFGEQGIYFVETLRQYLVNPLVGWSQGHFLVERDVQGTERMMTNQKLKVMDIESPNQSRPMFSDGIAGGVRTSSAKSAATSSMKKADFKQVLKTKMSAIKANRTKQ